MRSYLIRGVVALAVVLAVALPAAAQSIVRGRVVDAMGQPVEGATVSIEAVGAARRVEAKTDRNGTFSQVGLPTGQYNIVVSKDTLKVTAPAMISQGRPTELVITLAPGGGTGGVDPEAAKEAEALKAAAESGVAAMNAGRFDEAIKAFQDILLKIPTCADCHYNIGQAYAKQMKWAEAEAAYQEAIKINPNHADSYTGLANIYNSQRKLDLAAQASAKAAELSAAGGGGASAEAMYNQGVILWNAGKFAEAKVQFESAAKADPKMAMAHYQLGMANLNLGDVAGARAAFQEYLKADPNGPKAAEVKVFLSQLPQ
jgi:tetratricopeptide (TPR) repeat protein